MATIINLPELIDEETLQSAVEELNRLGITVEEFIAGTFARIAKKQILQQNTAAGSHSPMNSDKLTDSEFVAEIMKGLDDAENGRLLTEEEVFDEVERFIDSL